MTERSEQEKVLQPKGCTIRVVVRKTGSSYIANFYAPDGMFMFDVVPEGAVDREEFLQYCEYLACSYDDAN